MTTLAPKWEAWDAHRPRSIPLGPFATRRLRAPALWIDPLDRTSLTLLRCAHFGATGNYLATADHSDFDFSSVQKFSVELWRQRSIRLDGTGGTDDGFIGQYDYNVSASWAIGSGGSVNQGISARFLIATNADGTTLATVTTPPGADWSHCVVTFDGTEGTATDRCKIYLDGVLSDPGSYITSGTLPTNPQNSSADVTVGRGVTAHGLADGAISRARIWKNRILDSTAVTALYNSGAGLFHAALSSSLQTSLVASWDLTEATGSDRIDSAGSHDLTETGGDVAHADLVMKLIEKGPNRFEFTPVGSGSTAFGVAFCGAPYWLETGLGGRPCLDLRSNHGMYCAATQALDFGSFDYLHAVSFTTFADDETFLLVGSDEDSAAAYMFSGEYTNTNHYSRFRVRDNNSPNNFNTSAISDIQLSTATPYVGNWRAFGTGDDASWEHRLNGADAGISYATVDAKNKSWDDVKGRDNLAIGCLCRSDGMSAQIGKSVLFGEVLVYGWAADQLSEAENRELEDYLARQIGVTLA